MAVISEDIYANNQEYAVKYDSSPESIIIKKDVFVFLASYSVGSAAVKGYGLSSAGLYNYGHVIAQQLSVGVSFDGDYCYVNNAAGAEISVALRAIYFGGKYATLNNDGQITANYAAYFATGGTVNNRGSLNGAIFSNAQINNFVLYNSGSCSGSISIYLSSKNTEYGEASIINTGDISGDISFTDGASGFSTVKNAGLIRGDLNLSTAKDTCDNRGGHIIGDVALNGGDDTFDNRGGHIDGIVSGGKGNDVYIVDATPLAIVERVGEGIDTIKAATVSLDLTKYDGIENATLLGGLALNATGDENANTLTGNLGVNVLKGLAGNDVYVVQNKADQVIEAAGGGTDTVVASVSYELTAGQAIEVLKADALVGAIDLTGNALGQVITGNASNNVIDGRAGNDTLTGGSTKDADTFVFSTALGPTNVDHIVDFSAPTDTIRLSKAIFTALSGGALAASAFKDLSVAGAKVDADDHILYNKTTGALFYDADGSGSKAAVQFAILDNKAAITAADFFVFTP